jgi:hypothetical protein
MGRKTVLAAELTKLSGLVGIASIDDAKLKREVRERAANVKALLGENTTQARQMLPKLLGGPRSTWRASVRAASAAISFAMN